MNDFASRPHGALGELGPGSRIAGYRIEERIGEGGMAVVFRARDERLQRPAAVKVIAPWKAHDPQFRARFLRETRSAGAVDSLHILPVYGAGEDRGLLYIATRFVAGGDLAALLHREGGRLAPGRAVALVAQVASALDAAHAADLVHRDVKPQNILVDSVPERPEHVYLADFGLSKGIKSPTKVTATGQFVGTPDYASPEQITNVDVDGRADQYALACVAFILLTGTLPFDRGETMATLFAQVHDPVPAATDLRPELPAAVTGVLARGLAKSPGGRYASCGEFARALREALPPALAAVTTSHQRRPVNGEEPVPAAFIRTLDRPDSRSRELAFGQADDAVTRRAGGKRRSLSRSGDRRQWMAIGAIAVVAAGTISGVLMKYVFAGPGGPAHTVAGPGGPAHTMAAPRTVAGFSRSATLEKQLDVADDMATVVKGSSGRASDVVFGVYRKANLAFGTSTQVFTFVGGKLAGADPSASVASFEQKYPGAKTVSPGSFGGEEACTETTVNWQSTSICVWFDNDTFGTMMSPTMTAAKLASTMNTVRPSLEQFQH